MDSDSYKTKIEYGVATVVILIGLFFIYQASTIKASKEAIGPQTMPMFLAIFLIIGGLWLAFRAWRGKVGEVKEGYGFLESDISRIFQIVGAGVLFVVLFWAVGYFVAVICTFIAMLYTFGVRSWLKMIVGAVVLAMIFQWLFMGIMLLNDPKGALIDLRPYTNWISGSY